MRRSPHFLPAPHAHSALVGASFLLLAACGASTDVLAGTSPGGDFERAASARLEPFECGSITRLHTFDGIFLASQPSAADFEHAADAGVRTVVDLRHADETPDVDARALVTDLGLVYEAVPWNGVDELTDEVFDRCRELLNTAERPVLMYCKSANRVGAVWLPWRVLDGDLSEPEAVAEAGIVGLRSPAYEERARRYVEDRRATAAR